MLGSLQLPPDPFCCRSAGTGKTMLACAAATAAGARLLVLNGPDIVTEHSGESEAGLRGVFAAAAGLAPAVRAAAVACLCWPGSKACRAWPPVLLRQLCEWHGSQPVGCVSTAQLLSMTARQRRHPPPSASPHPPQLIFIDELDALAPARSGPGGKPSAISSTSARMVATLVTEMDRLGGAARGCS
jgi:SpoVK/Ycf46/Vps4 family AAA+-type ATPase